MIETALTSRKGQSRIVSEPRKRSETLGISHSVESNAKCFFLSLTDERSDGRLSAAEKLHDRTILTKLALCELSPALRAVVLDNLADQGLRADGSSPAYRFAEINGLDDADPFLMLIGRVEDRGAGSDAADQDTVSEAGCCLARMKLAAREPAVQARLPGLRSTGAEMWARQSYGHGYTLHAERVTIGFVQTGKTLAARSWSAEFPPFVTFFGGTENFRAANVSGGELLKELFGRSVFSEADRTELARPDIPEVRVAAASLLRGRAIPTRAAGTDKKPDDRWAYVRGHDSMPRPLGGAHDPR